MPPSAPNETDFPLDPVDPSKPYIFISYAHENGDFARRLAHDLQRANINIWLDELGLSPGVPDWEEAIRAAIDGCRGILLIASPAARVSRYVRAELAFAQADQKPIIPVWAEGAEWSDSITMALLATQNIDARGDLYDTAFNRIVTSCKRLLNDATSIQPTQRDIDQLIAPPLSQTITERQQVQPRRSNLPIIIGITTLLALGALLFVFIMPTFINPPVPTPTDSPTVTPSVPPTQMAALPTNSPTLSPTETSESTQEPTATAEPELTETTVLEFACAEEFTLTTEGQDFCAAMMLTSGFEGGGYATYQNRDAGIVAYGRFLFTLASGSLFSLVDRYISASSSEIATELNTGYRSRLESRDPTLRDDARLEELLIAAAADPVMQQAQDELAKELYWDRVMALSVEPRCIETPLGKALLFDMAINHGMTGLAEQELGLEPKNCISESNVDEHTLIQKIAEIRQARMNSLAEQLNAPGLISRGDFWVNLVAQGDWELQGDPLGHIEIRPGRIVVVRKPDESAECVATAIGRDGLRLRESPVTGEELARIPYGTELTVQELLPEGGTSNYMWAKVTYLLDQGWVRDDFLSYSPCPALNIYERYPAPLTDYWWVRGFNLNQNPNEENHLGWDFGINTGEPVRSGPNGGRVVRLFTCTACTPENPSSVSQGYALNDSSIFLDPAWGYGYGNAIIVRYLNAQLPTATVGSLNARGLSGAHLYCIYAQLSSIAVNEGDDLEPNQIIGNAGGTGSAAAAHLHLECRASFGANDPNWTAMRPSLLDPGILYMR